jgi:hypothetical protein
MTSDILHKLPDSPFAVWEAPKGRRGDRFAIIEPGVGYRGMALRRGTARTLAGASELASSLSPSTPADILARIEAHGEMDHGRLETLHTLSQPGTKLWIICDGYGYEAVSDGLVADGIEAMFGGDGELRCWLIRWHDPDGTECKGLYAVALEDAERAWWILSADGRVVAGGPSIFDHDRALELAAQFGGRAVHGTASLPRTRADQ